jgi:hypothetical protein
VFVNGGLPREPVIVVDNTPRSAPASIALPLRKPAVPPPYSTEAHVQATAVSGALEEDGETAADYHDLRRKLLGVDRTPADHP